MPPEPQIEMGEMDVKLPRLVANFRRHGVTRGAQGERRQTGARNLSRGEPQHTSQLAPLRVITRTRALHNNGRDTSKEHIQDTGVAKLYQTRQPPEKKDTPHQVQMEAMAGQSCAIGHLSLIRLWVHSGCSINLEHTTA